MFSKKKASLELSVNAIVVIVLAITMLGLGLGFLRGIFSKSIGQVQDQLKGLEQQRIDALKADCDNGLCLESTKIDIKKNEDQHFWLVIYNKFDCDISNVVISIAGQAGGSTKFPVGTCQMIPTEDATQAPQCSDITIQNVPLKNVDHKKKNEVLVSIKAKSSAKPTVYAYDIDLTGSCTYAGSTFSLDQKETLTVNVEG